MKPKDYYNMLNLNLDLQKNMNKIKGELSEIKHRIDKPNKHIKLSTIGICYSIFSLFLLVLSLFSHSFRVPLIMTLIANLALVIIDIRGEYE